MKRYTKYERLKIYKSLLKELKKAEHISVTRGFYAGEVNFCKLLDSVELQDLPELIVYRPSFRDRWAINESYWFSPSNISERILIILTVLEKFHVSFWDILFNRK